MSTIPRSLVNNFSDALESSSLRACSDIDLVWNKLKVLPPDKRGEYVGDLFEAIVDTHGTQASQAAKEFYENVRSLYSDDEFEAILDDPEGRDWFVSDLEGAYREFVLDGDDEERFLREAKKGTDLALKMMARGVIFSNTQRDPLKPRYARVPRGKHTCAFCIMLASRGAVYHTEDTAGLNRRYHAYCDCAVVPIFPGQTVEGYDPDGMFERYAACVRTVETKGLGSGDKTALILKEMRRRDPEWLMYGKVPKIKYEVGAKPRKHEIKTAERLAQHGFNIEFRKPKDISGVKTSDIFMLHKKSREVNRVPWEIKHPHGSGESNIRNQFNEAKGQAPRLILDITDSPKSTDQIIHDCRLELERKADYHGINEVLLVGNDNYLKRLRNKKS